MRIDCAWPRLARVPGRSPGRLRERNCLWICRQPVRRAPAREPLEADRPGAAVRGPSHATGASGTGGCGRIPAAPGGMAPGDVSSGRRGRLTSRVRVAQPRMPGGPGDARRPKRRVRRFHRPPLDPGPPRSGHGRLRRVRGFAQHRQHRARRRLARQPLRRGSRASTSAKPSRCAAAAAGSRQQPDQHRGQRPAGCSPAAAAPAPPPAPPAGSPARRSGTSISRRTMAAVTGFAL